MGCLYQALWKVMGGSPLGAELPLKSQCKRGTVATGIHWEQECTSKGCHNVHRSLTFLQEEYQQVQRYLPAPQLSSNNCKRCSEELQTFLCNSWALDLECDYLLGFKRQVTLRPKVLEVFNCTWRNFWGSEPECVKSVPKKHLRLRAEFNTGIGSILGDLLCMTKTKMYLQQVPSFKSTKKKSYFL